MNSRLPQNWSFPAAGVLGLFGGASASSTLMTNHAFGQKVIPSLYNSPGSVPFSKQLILLCSSRSLDAQDQSVIVPVSSFFTFPIASGPRFTATHSGTRIVSTGDVSRVLLDACKNLRPDAVAKGRVTVRTYVTVVKLRTPPAPEEHPRAIAGLSILRLIPIVTSIAGCAICALNGDAWSAAMIAAGMISTGFASHAINSGDLTFSGLKSAPGAPPGDGFLEADNEILVLRGEEAAVAAVTRGNFALRFESEYQLCKIAFSSNLLTAQSVAQLLFFPFGSPVGQLTVLGTLGISWLYNLYAAAWEKDVWRRMVVEDVLKKPTMKRYVLGTRSAAAVFVMAMLKPTNVEKRLFEIIPNGTVVWSLWRERVAQALEVGSHDPTVPKEEMGVLSLQDQQLLQTLIDDAKAALDPDLHS